MLSKRLIKKAADDKTMRKEFIDKLFRGELTEQEIGQSPLLDKYLVDFILHEKDQYDTLAIFESMCDNDFVALEGKALEYFIDEVLNDGDDFANKIYALPNRLDYFEYRFNILFKNKKRLEKLYYLVDEQPNHPFSKIFKEITKKHIKKQRFIQNPEVLSFVNNVYSPSNRYDRVLEAAKEYKFYSNYSADFFGAFSGLDEKILEELDNRGANAFEIFKGICRNGYLKKNKPHVIKKFIEDRSVGLVSCIDEVDNIDERMFYLKNIFEFSPDYLYRFLRPEKELIDGARKIINNKNPKAEDKEFHDFLRKWLEDSHHILSLLFNRK